MFRSWIPSLLAFGLTLSLLQVTGCESDLEPVQLPDEVSAENLFVGAERCGDCHATQYDAFVQSGHGYKLNRVVDAQVPTYPFRDQVNYPVENPPSGYGWADVLYVIGGYGWKARFIGLDGNIITGSDVQYNLETGGWVAYHEGETKAYDCGRCHTTGYDPDGHQLGLDGLVGTWAEDGITCERCHGAGGLHATSQNPSDLRVDLSSDLCGECHYRDSQHRIAVGGVDDDGDQFIRHHEQYDEMISAGHKNLTCVSCHDPHKSALYQTDEAIVLDCETCHSSIEVYVTGHDEHTCVNCHMARASKSAVKRSGTEGDLRTHIFRIEASADSVMFYQDGSSWFSRGYVTTDFACLNCHTDAEEDRAWAETYAATIHTQGNKTWIAGR